ncbi:hypothetical protein HH214_11340 [Mucilaginibacter robiniae]|uniref:Uncharacterized protein n=1 Tax=Mucilaginibacter robiniae TaxID=2728022 RepID=A0A7L5DZ92_9SPHI|nr:hypothetical protein [Mucilaginibacter robiniae]QJD96420.1 hypothetical protein HH214_11340 [Mucilaginibacter robiniae]
MDDVFLLTVPYRNEDLEFESRLILSGYIYRIEVNVNGIPVLFEPDEERNYRALISPEQVESKGSQLKRDLLQAVAQALEALHQ